MIKLKTPVVLVCGFVALALAGCEDIDDSEVANDVGSSEEITQEEKDDRAQKAANDAIVNTGGMNVDYGN
jgi:hypothetical protein